MTEAEVTNLILTIVKPLVENPDDVRVGQKQDDHYVYFELSVNADDIGRIIGKHGQVAQAIRTIIYGVRLASSKRVRLNILD
ncbi:KH domain-containing protein [Dellaglioa algida]|uniref:RNA-binding protein KhpA n=1 Tax=Dellaglioa algida TaxID=105612 RepID=A0A5C6M9I1_9LACO|nr:KH domain-containing protein [Dellaglioa algida]MDK1716784.1 KH domain-containing protein [Dellaglioa algida]MDK1720563.1 KH domain-containing protein [Dellaglioa algida]MDK1721726.1 KH domain-containing protein [Dellaglioa algida]MDK1723675.1 KH domain-containing protein [Dellaglioa algida]MDK1725254.1 KH domain-containing protein [Dellaglioa algida]